MSAHSDLPTSKAEYQWSLVFGKVPAPVPILLHQLFRIRKEHHEFLDKVCKLLIQLRKTISWGISRLEGEKPAKINISSQK